MRGGGEIFFREWVEEVDNDRELKDDFDCDREKTLWKSSKSSHSELSSASNAADKSSSVSTGNGAVERRARKRARHASRAKAKRNTLAAAKQTEKRRGDFTFEFDRDKSKNSLIRTSRKQRPSSPSGAGSRRQTGRPSRRTESRTWFFIPKSTGAKLSFLLFFLFSERGVGEEWRWRRDYFLSPSCSTLSFMESKKIILRLVGGATKRLDATSSFAFCRLSLSLSPSSVSLGNL